MSEFDTNGRWLPIQIAPDDCDLELGQPHKTGILPWAFPCRRRRGVWFNGWADEPVLIAPSHWRVWRSDRQGAGTLIYRESANRVERAALILVPGLPADSTIVFG